MIVDRDAHPRSCQHRYCGFQFSCVVNGIDPQGRDVRPCETDNLKAHESYVCCEREITIDVVRQRRQPAKGFPMNNDADFHWHSFFCKIVKATDGLCERTLRLYDKIVLNI